MKYTNAKTETTKHLVPGYHYFKKMYSFMDSHCIIMIGEMFLEYLNGACKENEEIRRLCDSCSTREQCCEEIKRVARYFPTTKVVGIIISLCLKPNEQPIHWWLHATGVAEQQHKHQVNAPWMTPAVSQQNLLRLRDAWKTSWSFWQYWILRKIEGKTGWGKQDIPRVWLEWDIQRCFLTEQKKALLDKYLKRHELPTASN